jgi:uncharacterized protein (TIGR02118 family)
MVKLVFLCRRRPDVSHERYAAMLLDDHVPLALRHHPAMRRYVVHIVDEASPGAPPLDSIGVLWFDSLDDYRARLYDSPEGERIIGRDVARFLGGADAYATTERLPAPAAVDTIAGVPAGVDAWRDRVGTVVARRLSPTGPDYVGFAELDGWPTTMPAGAHAYRVRRHVAR